MHLDDERLQRLLDDELSRHDGHAVRAHLDECAACRERVAAARHESAAIDELLSLLDHPDRPPALAEVLGTPARGRSGARWAAAAVLVLGVAGVAYALPASPLPRWIAAVAERLAPRSPAPTAGPVRQQVPVAGIAVPPDEQLVIAFDSAQAEGDALVTLREDAAEVTIRAPDGAARFTAAPDRVSVANAGSRASYLIEVPSHAPRVEIRVAGSRRFLKVGGLVSPPPEDSGSPTHRVSLRP